MGFGGDNVSWQVVPRLCELAQSAPAWQVDCAALGQDTIAASAGAVLNGRCVCERAAPQLITADFHRLVCLSLPVVVLEQFEYARWGRLPLPASPTSTSTTATPSSASAASSPEHGGSGAAQCRRQRSGRSVQHACSSGSKRLSGDPDAGAAALSAHGGKARGCPQQPCPPGPQAQDQRA